MRPAHRDTARQQGIHAAHPCGQRALGLGVKMDHLFESVYAGVGTPRRDDRNNPSTSLLSGNLAQGPLQRVLNGLTVRLTLPSAKRRAVILHTQRDPQRSVPYNISTAKPTSSASLKPKRYSASSICLLFSPRGSNKLRKLSCHVFVSRSIATSA